MKMVERRRSLIEYIAVPILAAAIIFGLLIMAGTLQSGMHVADDHEIYRMSFRIKEQGASVWTVMADQIKADLSWRFRPLYWLERVLGTAVFGTDFFCWNVYTALKSVFSFCLLYFGARNLKYKQICSFLFPCIVMLGAQITPVYRSANQESTGLLLCTMALWLITKQYKERAFRKKAYNIAICVCAIACGLVKESFTIFMPVFVAIKYWLEYCEMCDSEPERERKWWECFKGSGITYAVIVAAMACNVYYILFRVGVDNVSYAGFHEGVSLSYYYTAIYENLFYYLEETTAVGIILFFVMVFSYDLIEKKDIKRYLGFGLIAAYIMATQLIIHAESRIWERYIIPYIVGYAIFFVLMGYRMFEHKKVQRTIYTVLLLYLLCKQVPIAYGRASDYAEDGRQTGRFVQCIQEHTDGDTLIVAAFSADELNLTVESVMETSGRHNAYSYSWKDSAISNYIQLISPTRDIQSMEEADVTTCYDWDVADVLKLMNVADDLYEVYSFTDYSVIVRHR